MTTQKLVLWGAGTMRTHRTLWLAEDLGLDYEHRPIGPRTVEILDTEEKGSDVNLASYLLLDGFENDYEMAVVISNDSDLQLPIRMTRTKLGKQLGVIDPSNKTSFELRKAASWYRRLRRGPLSG